jgi:hypothetical protein
MYSAIAGSNIPREHKNSRDLSIFLPMVVGRCSRSFLTIQKQSLKATGRKNMKKLVLLFAIMLMTILVLMVVINCKAFAQSATTPSQTSKKDYVVHFSGEEGKDTEMVLSAPGQGENLTVIVDVPVRTRKSEVSAHVTNITNVHKGSNLRMRGGVSVGVLFAGAEASMTATVGLVGEVGYTDSPWRMVSRFDLGRCQDNNTAIGGSLSALHRLDSGFWGGFGADLSYCVDVGARYKERGKERLVGGSARFAYEEEYRHSSVVVEFSLGLGQKTFPIPGGRAHGMVGNAGLLFSYLF